VCVRVRVRVRVRVCVRVRVRCACELINEQTGLFVGHVSHAGSLAKGDSHYYSVSFPPCANLMLVLFPSSGSGSMYLGQDGFDFPSAADNQWSSLGDGSRPVYKAYCCALGVPEFNGSRPLNINVYANSNMTYELLIYDMSELLPVTHFYRYGTRTHARTHARGRPLASVHVALWRRSVLTRMAVGW
jgi:hypothetical protein